MKYCKYGCGQLGIKQLKNGNWICSDDHRKCPVNKKKYSQSGSKNPMFGKECVFKGKSKDDYKPLKIASEKCKQAHKDGLYDHIIHDEWIGRKHTKETKMKIAKAMKGNNFGKGRGKITFYKDIKMRSTWEAKVAEYLDNQNVIWKYEEKTFSLNLTQSYRPDFFIYDIDGNFIKLIEVKGYFREENKKKFDLFLKQYPNIIVELWDEEVLKNKSLI